MEPGLVSCRGTGIANRTSESMAEDRGGDVLHCQFTLVRRTGRPDLRHSHTGADFGLAHNCRIAFPLQPT